MANFTISVAYAVKNCVRGLGLSKLGQVLMISDTPENRGMIKTAKHLVEVKEKWNRSH